MEDILLQGASAAIPRESIQTQNRTAVLRQPTREVLPDKNRKIEGAKGYELARVDLINQIHSCPENVHIDTINQGIQRSNGARDVFESHSDKMHIIAQIVRKKA